MTLLQTLRQAICTASFTIGAEELRCGLASHGGGMHCDTRAGIGLWWMAAAA